ncbi:unnamed protein product [Moneuplotes crassus]|uniref:Uncharacterized protein n=1 Tax=Euplotes crassus TaxID=5936 RepID=A0AAD1UBA0_EUPCR|nr:unnamed protein product [Moneuplotes crassus]
MRKRIQLGSCRNLKTYKDFLISVFRQNRHSFEQQINAAGISYCTKLYQILKETKLMTPSIASNLPYRVHLLNLDRASKSPENVKERLEAIQTMQVDGNVQKLYKNLISDCHLLSKQEFDNMDDFIKTKLNYSRRLTEFFDIDEDIEKKKERTETIGGIHELILQETGIDKETRDKHYEFEISQIEQEYTVKHLKNGTTVTFVQTVDHDIESLEREISKQYSIGPDVVLIDQKPYYKDLMRWHYSSDVSKNQHSLNYDHSKRFFDSAKELKEYFHVLLKDSKDFKVEQQSRIIYENCFKTKQINIGYSILLNILFVMGKGNLDIKTGLISPTLNELMQYYVTNMELEGAKDAYKVIQHRIFIDRLDYVLNKCFKKKGCVKCNPIKISTAPSSVYSFITDYELDRSIFYNTMAKNISRSVNTSPDKTKIRVLISSKSNSLQSFLSYIKYYTNSGSNPYSQPASIPSLSVEQVNTLLYLRAIFSEDKEHVYEMDKLFSDPESGDRYKEFYHKLASEITNNHLLSAWPGAKKDYQCYPINMVNNCSMPVTERTPTFV